MRRLDTRRFAWRTRDSARHRCGSRQTTVESERAVETSVCLVHELFRVAADLAPENPKVSVPSTNRGFECDGVNLEHIQACAVMLARVGGGNHIGGVFAGAPKGVDWASVCGVCPADPPEHQQVFRQAAEVNANARRMLNMLPCIGWRLAQVSPRSGTYWHRSR